MGLIDKYSNIYFLVARKLIDFANNHNGITEKQIRKIADKYGVLEDNNDFVNAVIGLSDEDNKFNRIKLFYYDDKSNKYISIIKNLPVVLNLNERNSLIDALKHTHAKAFVDSKTLDKFCVPEVNESEMVHNLRRSMIAIQHDQWIIFDNITAEGVKYKNQHIKPHKIEIVAENSEYYVSGFSKEADRLIKCNLKRMTIHNIINGEDIDLTPYLEEKRSTEPIRLRIENCKGATDRAFNIFSGYEKEGYYDKEKDYYILDIYYYQFEERILIDKILSLGAMAIVLSPIKIVEIIKGRIKEQLKRLT